ncbi:MAG: site-specific integrase [Trichodesmium sp. MO_231.B1]|nr:site-specific integrase [Trichodesmium sp. MO_231.B1]
MKRSRKGKAAILKSWEAQAIYDNFTTPTDKLIWQILRFTGERISAVLALEVGNVYYKPERSLPYPEITFPASSRKKAPDGTADTRQVPIVKPLLVELQNFSPPKDSLLMFPAPRSRTKPIGRTSYDRNFRMAVRKAGLSDKGISLHSTRRTLITRLHEAGYSIALIQQSTGHKSLNALREYIDIDAKAVGKAIDSIDL